MSKLDRFFIALFLAAVVGMLFTAGYGLRTVLDIASWKTGSSPKISSLQERMPGVKRSKEPQEEDMSPAESYVRVLGLLKEYYVDKIEAQSEQKMARESVKWMVQSLEDPESRFLEPQEHQILKANNRGEFYGIGAILTVQRREINKIPEERLIVIAPMPGSPALKMGLQSGDVITHIDGHWIIASNPLLEEYAMFSKLRAKEITQQQFDAQREELRKRVSEGVTRAKAMETLTGKTTRTAVLTVERAGEAKPFQVSVQCGPTAVKPVEFRMEAWKTGLLDIHQFHQSGIADLDKAVNSLRQHKINRLVVDLRNNPGGSIDVATRMASRFASTGSLGKLETKKGSRRLDLVKGKHSIYKGQFVLLINRGTAGAAEAFAAGLRESGLCRTVGQPTYGSGKMQTLIALNDGSAMTITTARYLTPRGADLNGKGLKPDTAVTGSPDAQLQAALRMAQAG
ncbi:MAG: PDZ domain-containing protein [Armatimonadetes bacterium]|nr:PDZ domain-containing protein [Armatimonadota bacterium]